jgi:uncharacterized membrane protein YciS (DUF1049 family)
MKVKLVISIILISITVLFVYLNTNLVSIDYLAGSVDVSLALLVLIAFAAGLTIGWLLNSFLRFSRTRKKSKEESNKQAKQAITETESVTSTTGETKSDAQQD